LKEEKPREGRRPLDRHFPFSKGPQRGGEGREKRRGEKSVKGKKQLTSTSSSANLHHISPQENDREKKRDVGKFGWRLLNMMWEGKEGKGHEKQGGKKGSSACKVRFLLWDGKCLRWERKKRGQKRRNNHGNCAGNSLLLCFKGGGRAPLTVIIFRVGGSENYGTKKRGRKHGNCSNKSYAFRGRGGGEERKGRGKRGGRPRLAVFFPRPFAQKGGKDGRGGRRIPTPLPFCMTGRSGIRDGRRKRGKRELVLNTPMTAERSKKKK